MAAILIPLLELLARSAGFQACCIAGFLTCGSTGPPDVADLKIHRRTEQLGHFVTVKSFLQVGHTVTTLIIIGQNPLFPRSQTWNCDRGKIKETQ